MNNRIIDFPEFYRRLEAMGFDRNYLKRMVLPDWWIDEYEQESPGAIVDAISYTSRRLNIDRDSLMYIDSIPEFNSVKFLTQVPKQHI